MSNLESDAKRALVRIETLTTSEELAALQRWGLFLAELKGRNLTLKAIRREIRGFVELNPDVTEKAKSVLVKARQATWTNRTITQRWMIWSMLVLPTAFAGKGVGIATAGFGVGLRLSTVVWGLSSGAIAVIENHFLSKSAKTEYSVIDAEKKSVAEASRTKQW